jgi:hypothetical protein
LQNIDVQPESSVRGELAFAVAISGAFAVLVGFVSTNLNSRFEHRAETIQQQFAILAGGPYPIDGVFTEVGAYQNRVLFPLGLEALSGLTAGSVGQWYLLLRLATAFGAFITSWYLLRRRTNARRMVAAVGLGLLAYELVFTFAQGWEHPTDFPDVALTGLWLWAAMAGRRWGLLAVALGAAFNRESAAFAGVLWLVLYGFTVRWTARLSELAFGILASVASYALVLGIRWSCGGSTDLTHNTNALDFAGTLPRLWEAVTHFLEHPTPWSWPVLMLAMVALPGLWIWVNRSYIGAREWRVLIASVAILVLSLPFASLDEPRDFMTSIVLVIFVAVAGEAARERCVSGNACNH